MASMNITYDPIVDAASITFKKAKIFETIQVTPLLNIDTDKWGNLVALEILDVKKQIGTRNFKNMKFKLLDK